MTASRSATRTLTSLRLVFAVSVAFVMAATVRALRRDPLTAPAHVTASTIPPIHQQPPERPHEADIARLISGDPFSPLRTAPDVPYRIGAAGPDSIFMRSAAPVRLLGTIVGGTGRSFAMCRIEGEPARVVYPGERIGGMTLERVSQGSAVFIDEAGARVVLRVPRTGG